MELVDVLTTTKVLLQESGAASTFIEFEGIGPIRVFRIGRNRGKERGQHFEFRITYDNVPIAIANRLCGTDQLPNVWIQLTGENCLLSGAEAGYSKSRGFIERLGGVITQETLSRVDLTIDIAGLHVGVLQ